MLLETESEQLLNYRDVNSETDNILVAIQSVRYKLVLNQPNQNEDGEEDEDESENEGETGDIDLDNLEIKLGRRKNYTSFQVVF